MIIESDSGLSTANYAALLAATTDPTLEAVLEQYSLAFSSHDSDGHTSAIDQFDAIVCDDVIVRAYRSAADTLSIQTLATEDGGDQSWSAAVDLAATDISATVAVTLATDGSTDVRVFYYDAVAEQIEYFENTAKGVGAAGTWGATTLVIAAADLEFLAAAALTRVHYTILTSENNRRLYVVNFNGSWSATASDVYWQLEIDSFDAVVGSQVDDGAAATNDIIVMSSYLPHIISRKIENTELIYTVNEVQGLVIFRYQNGRWNEHRVFDVVDEAPSFPSRYDVRLSSSGEWLFLTYFRKDGTATYSHTAIAISRSKDGIRWELPYLITQDIDPTAILLKRGNHAYLLNSDDTYRSMSSGYTGDAQTTLDITTRVTNRVVRMGDIQQAQLVIANPEQVLDTEWPFSAQSSLQLRLKDGYWAGYAVEFNGISTYGDCGSDASLDNLPLGAILVASAWVRCDAAGAGNETILFKYTNTDGGWLMRLDPTQNVRFIVFLDNTNASAHVGTLPSIVDEEWHYVEGFYNDATKTARLSLDGVWGAASVGVGNYGGDAANNLFIGRTNTSRFWNGGMACIELSDADRHGGAAGIDFDTDLPHNPYDDSDTIESWPFDEGAGGTGAATILGANDCILTDASWLGTAQKLVVQTVLADVDVLGGNEQLPTDHIQLVGRDLLGRMRSFQADQVNEWESQIIGGDNFENSDDTPYSGLRHTAVQEGHWKTEDNELYIVPNESPCIAFNTYATEAINGSCQGGIKVAANDSDDYAGFVFRAYDKHNCMLAYYDADNDVIKLVSRQDNQDTEITDSSTMSWSVDTWYWLKVHFRYGYVTVYSSTDGITWVARISTEVSGIPNGTSWLWDNITTGAIPNLTGRMGYVAHGYSDEDDSYSPPPIIIPQEPVPPTDPPEQAQWIAGMDGGDGAAYCNDIFNAPYTWTFENEGLPTVGWNTFYDFKLFHHPDGNISLFAVTFCGIAEYRYLPMPGGKWHLLADTASLATAAGLANAHLDNSRMRLSIERAGWGYVGFYCNSGSPFTLCLARTEDYWQSIAAAYSIVTGANNNGGGTIVDIAQHSNAATVWLSGMYQAGAGPYGAIYKCTSYGAASAQATNQYGGAYSFGGYVHCPYHSAGWDDSVVIASSHGGGGVPSYDVGRSSDTGGTWGSLGQPSNEVVGISTPTFDRNLICVVTRNSLWEYTGGAFVQFGPGIGFAPASSFVVERDTSRRVVYWLLGGAFGGAPRISLVDSVAETNIRGNLATSATGTVRALAGLTLEPVV